MPFRRKFSLLDEMTNYLHPYWRIEYIKSTPDAQKLNYNPFVDLPKMGDDRKALILFRGEHSYIVMNKYPYNAGHLLVVPYRQLVNITDMTDIERNDLFKNVAKAQDVLTKALQPDSFNIGINMGIGAGGGIPQHLHCHVVPRWIGDTNFMPISGSERILPFAMDYMWEKLQAFF